MSTRDSSGSWQQTAQSPLDPTVPTQQQEARHTHPCTPSHISSSRAHPGMPLVPLLAWHRTWAAGLLLLLWLQ